MTNQRRFRREPGLRTQRCGQIEGVAGMPSTGAAQTKRIGTSRGGAPIPQIIQLSQEPLITPFEAAIGTPSQPQIPAWAMGPVPQPMHQHGIIGRSHRPRMATQAGRRWSDQSKQIDHHQTSIAPGPGIAAQTPQGGVIASGIGVGRIQSAEDQLLRPVALRGWLKAVIPVAL